MNKTKLPSGLPLACHRLFGAQQFLSLLLLIAKMAYIAGLHVMSYGFDRNLGGPWRAELAAPLPPNSCTHWKSYFLDTGVL